MAQASIFHMVEAAWMVAFSLFLVTAVYAHFRVRPFDPYVLVNPQHENHKKHRAVFVAFVALLISGLVLFA